MVDFLKLFNKDKTKNSLTKDEIAELLNTNTETLIAFEKSYQSAALLPSSNSIFVINAKQAAEQHVGVITSNIDGLADISNRIVNELLEKTAVWSFDGVTVTHNMGSLPPCINNPVANDDLKKIPEEFRPMLTGNLLKRDLSGYTAGSLFYHYKMSQNAKTQKERECHYHLFRQGLDILDLDAVTYAMLDMNPNSMGYWLPNIIQAVINQGFFKIPKTKIIKVPIPVLQLTRLDYELLNRTTLDIVNDYCYKVFDLDLDGDYFIKTGTYSSKFDFRNAHVVSPKEVREIGEYLLYIQHQACVMAGPLTSPCMYGVSTTNEWVVREFIQDVENNGTIYHGLPLHTEYRVFVDFNTDEILGISPYWEPNTMKKRFGDEPDSNEPDMVHDYISFKRMEDIMMHRYDENKNLVLSKLADILPDINLPGQWSVDIMQNGDDFWIIDMALAANSALQECIPAGKLNPVVENWLPKIN